LGVPQASQARALGGFSHVHTAHAHIFLAAGQLQGRRGQWQ
jgi:hypothetical protein